MSHLTLREWISHDLSLVVILIGRPAPKPKLPAWPIWLDCFFWKLVSLRSSAILPLAPLKGGEEGDENGRASSKKKEKIRRKVFSSGPLKGLVERTYARFDPECLGWSNEVYEVLRSSLAHSGSGLFRFSSSLPFSTIKTKGSNLTRRRLNILTPGVLVEAS